MTVFYTLSSLECELSMVIIADWFLDAMHKNCTRQPTISNKGILVQRLFLRWTGSVVCLWKEYFSRMNAIHFWFHILCLETVKPPSHVQLCLTDIRTEYGLTVYSGLSRYRFIAQISEQYLLPSAHFSVTIAERGSACARMWAAEYEFLQLIVLHTIDNCIYNINFL